MLRVGLCWPLILPLDLSLDWFCLLLDGVLLSDALWLNEILFIFLLFWGGEVWFISPVASLWWKRTFDGPVTPLEFDLPYIWFRFWAFASSVVALDTEYEPVFLAFGKPYEVRFPGLMADVDLPIPATRLAF